MRSFGEASTARLYFSSYDVDGNGGESCATNEIGLRGFAFSDGLSLGAVPPLRKLSLLISRKPELSLAECSRLLGLCFAFALLFNGLAIDSASFSYYLSLSPRLLSASCYLSPGDVLFSDLFNAARLDSHASGFSV